MAVRPPKGIIVPPAVGPVREPSKGVARRAHPVRPSRIVSDKVATQRHTVQLKDRDDGTILTWEGEAIDIAHAEEIAAVSLSWGDVIPGTAMLGGRVEPENTGVPEGEVEVLFAGPVAPAAGPPQRQPKR